MKYVKMLGLLAVAAAALMAFAGTASATTLTSPAGTTYTGEIHAVSIGHAVLHSSGISTVECSSTIAGTVESHGKGVTAKGKLSSLTFTGCTGSNTVTEVPKKGELEIHWISGTSNGTVTASNQEVVVFNSPLNGTCIYTTSNTNIGTLFGGNPAHLTTPTGGAVITRSGGSLGAFCGSTGTWTATYEVTTPKPLLVSE